MDIDKISFYPVLLDILTDISTSHFVAIDLELSGVPVRSSWGKDAGKPSLQERYLEIKEAAERFQILQIGLTCVEQNVDDGQYTLKPYNFDLCPIVNERGLDIERVFSFSSGAAEFLVSVGFDLNKPFTSGVPYLSRAESKLARQKHAQRQDKSAMADIQIKPTEVESLAFLDRVRGEINDWVKSRRMDTPDYVNIAPVGYDTIVDGQRSAEELSRFEKRLVHQLVRAEYPELVTVSRKGFIQIVPFNKEREDRIAAERQREKEERVNKQKGFRWIIDALYGGNIQALANILKEVAKDPITGEAVFADMDRYKAQFTRASVLLRSNPRVLVGHNCFLDMVYLYRTFIAELPATVEEFQRKLHALWPTVVDTKYMSTHKCGDISPVSSLEQIATQLSKEHRPIISTDPDHTKYNTVEAYHEAGYDSFLTAQIAVRLSAKLKREGQYVDTVQDDISNGVASIKVGQEAPEKLEETKKPNGSLNAEAKGFTPSVVGAKWKRRGDDTLGPADEDDPFEYDPTDLRHRHKPVEPQEVPDGMPKWSDSFWWSYGNKLRVFGTQEGVCMLDDAIESGNSDEDGGVTVD